MKPRLGRARALLAPLLAAPATAHAHLASTRLGDYYAGLLHPLTAFENLLPWLALGLLAGLHNGPAARWLLLVFPASVCMGAALSQLLPAVPGTSEFNLFSFVALGGLVALARPLPAAALLGLGALFGLAHGYGNGLALPPGGNLLLFVAGVTTAGYVAITLTTAATRAFVQERFWAAIAVRAAGSWIAAIGIMMVGIGFTSQ